MLRRLAVTALGTFCVLLPVQGGQRAASASSTDERMAIFGTVWRTVDERYFDPTFGGVDWRAVHDEFAARVRNARSDTQFYALLNEMLGRLGASHFSVRAPDSAGPVVDVDDASWGGGAGMTVRMVDDAPTVTRVEPAGAASAGGLKPGDVVVSIAGTDLAQLYRTERAIETPARAAFAVRRAAANLLGGMPGSSVAVAFRDASGASRTAELVRKGLMGRPMRYGNLPTVLVEVETRQLADGIGYLRFNTFLPQLVDELRASVRELSACRAIVVDLRGNSGGLATVAPAVAALFLDRPVSLGTMKFRNRELAFPTFAQPKPFLGRVAILVDESTASTSEILAASLAELGRATIVGEPTLGAALPSVIQKLPNGAVFQYAVANFRTPGGVLLEGRGVLPDVAARATRADCAAGRDAVLDAAVAFLEKRKTP